MSPTTERTKWSQEDLLQIVTSAAATRQLSPRHVVTRGGIFRGRARPHRTSCWPPTAKHD